MRGTLRSWRCEQCGDRIIPAYAGNTQHFNLQNPTRGDHPRVCGEHLQQSVGGVETVGSSPRMRGTRRRSSGLHAVPGIIPAYAGNTNYPIFSACNRRDHPRVCGEHDFDQLAGFRRQGSSPRMRGTPGGRAVGRCHPGIIPAYAGNTWWLSPSLVGNRDHPRVCGEHNKLRAVFGVPAGSSPRMRGTLFRLSAILKHAGIIPAYAGNTWWLSPSVIGNRDHPRVCGEHSKRLA